MSSQTGLCRRGRVSRFADLGTAYQQGRKLLKSQEYEVQQIVEAGDEVAVRTGMEGHPRGPRDKFARRERNENVRGDVSHVPRRKNRLAAKLRLLSTFRRATRRRGVSRTIFTSRLLIDILLRLQLPRQPIQVALLIGRSCRHRQLHFRCRVVKLALSEQARHSFPLMSGAVGCEASEHLSVHQKAGFLRYLVVQLHRRFICLVRLPIHPVAAGLFRVLIVPLRSARALLPSLLPFRA